MTKQKIKDKNQNIYEVTQKVFKKGQKVVVLENETGLLISNPETKTATIYTINSIMKSKAGSKYNRIILDNGYSYSYSDVYQITDNIEYSVNTKKRIIDINHYDLYNQIVNIIGMDVLKNYIPIPVIDIINKLKEGDIHLNNIPMKLWDTIAGYGRETKNSLSTSVSLVDKKLAILIIRAKKEIDPTFTGGISNSCCICTLKQNAILHALLNFNFNNTFEISYEGYIIYINYEKFLQGQRKFPTNKANKKTYDINYENDIRDKLLIKVANFYK